MTMYTNDEIRNFFAWQLQQTNPMTQVKNKDCWPVNTVDGLMASPTAVQTATDAMDRAERRIKLCKENGLPTDNIAPWEDPTWPEKQAAADAAETARKAEQAAQQSPFVTGVN